MPILGDPGAVSRVDKMFVVKVYCKIETSPWALTLTEPVPEAFELPASDWPEKIFFWPISVEKLLGEKRKKMIPYLFKFVEWFQRYEILKVRIFLFFVLKILNFPPKKWDQLAFFSIIVTIYLQLRVHSNYHYSSSL